MGHTDPCKPAPACAAVAAPSMASCCAMSPRRIVMGITSMDQTGSETCDKVECMAPDSFMPADQVEMLCSVCQSDGNSGSDSTRAGGGSESSGTAGFVVSFVFALGVGSVSYAF